jgi:hypothetical protein
VSGENEEVKNDNNLNSPSVGNTTLVSDATRNVSRTPNTIKLEYRNLNTPIRGNTPFTPEQNSETNSMESLRGEKISGNLSRTAQNLVEQSRTVDPVHAL